MVHVRKQSEYDRTVAEISSTKSLLEKFSKNTLSAMGLKSKLKSLESQLRSLSDNHNDTKAAVALYFGGRPVLNDLGIESEFAATIVSKFQDLVSKQFADNLGPVGERGKVPRKQSSKLHITGTVKGSFGFVFEELNSPNDLFDSNVKNALETSVDLISAFTNKDDEVFNNALSDANDRVLNSVKEFFEVLENNDARLRLVTDEKEKNLTDYDIDLAYKRASSSQFSEEQITLTGILNGALPDRHQFEMVVNDEVVNGVISKGISAHEILTWVKNFVGQRVDAEVYRKTLIRNGDIASQKFVLNGISISSI